MDRRPKALTGATNPVVKECRTCRMIPLTDATGIVLTPLCPHEADLLRGVSTLNSLHCLYLFVQEGHGYIK